MARKHQINYVKPNMAALHGRIGREIFEIILNTPKPDLTELNRRSDEVEARVLAARKARQDNIDKAVGNRIREVYTYEWFDEE